MIRQTSSVDDHQTAEITLSDQSETPNKFKSRVFEEFRVFFVFSVCLTICLNLGTCFTWDTFKISTVILTDREKIPR